MAYALCTMRFAFIQDKSDVITESHFILLYVYFVVFLLFFAFLFRGGAVLCVSICLL